MVVCHRMPVFWSWRSMSFTGCDSAGRPVLTTTKRVRGHEPRGEHPVARRGPRGRNPVASMRPPDRELKVATIDRYLWTRDGLTRRQTRKLIGFRFDEPRRWKPALYQQCEVAYPMVDARVTKADVAAFWQSQPFDLGIDSARGNLLATIRDDPNRADWWIAAERRKGRTFRRGESFEALRVAALAPNDTDEIGPDRGDVISMDSAGEPLPCFCTD